MPAQDLAVPEPTAPLGWAQLVPALRSFGPRYWFRAGALGAMSGLLIAVPTRLIPNSLFARMTPTRPLDYVFLAVSSVILGLVLAVPGEARLGGAVGGGFGTFLAVGCPVCNKLVVALLGVSGSLTYFAPLQPVLGASAVVLLLIALRTRVATRALAACPVPG